MGIGGKINRPRTELKKKLFKRRRVLARGAAAEAAVGAPGRAPPPAVGEAEAEDAEAAAGGGAGISPSPPDTAGGGGRRPERGDPPDVEMVAVGEP